MFLHLCDYSSKYENDKLPIGSIAIPSGNKWNCTNGHIGKSSNFLSETFNRKN